MSSRTVELLFTTERTVIPMSTNGRFPRTHRRSRLPCQPSLLDRGDGGTIRRYTGIGIVGTWKALFISVSFRIQRSRFTYRRTHVYSLSYSSPRQSEEATE